MRRERSRAKPPRPIKHLPERKPRRRLLRGNVCTIIAADRTVRNWQNCQYGSKETAEEIYLYHLTLHHRPVLSDSRRSVAPEESLVKSIAQSESDNR